MGKTIITIKEAFNGLFLSLLMDPNGTSDKQVKLSVGFRHWIILTDGRQRAKIRSNSG